MSHREAQRGRGEEETFFRKDFENFLPLKELEALFFEEGRLFEVVSSLKKNLFQNSQDFSKVFLKNFQILL